MLINLLYKKFTEKHFQSLLLDIIYDKKFL